MPARSESDLLRLILVHVRLHDGATDLCQLGSWLSQQLGEPFKKAHPTRKKLQTFMEDTGLFDMPLLPDTEIRLKDRRHLTAAGESDGWSAQSDGQPVDKRCQSRDIQPARAPASSSSAAVVPLIIPSFRPTSVSDGQPLDLRPMAASRRSSHSSVASSESECASDRSGAVAAAVIPSESSRPPVLHVGISAADAAAVFIDRALRRRGGLPLHPMEVVSSSKKQPDSNVWRKAVFAILKEDARLQKDADGGFAAKEGQALPPRPPAGAVLEASQLPHWAPAALVRMGALVRDGGSGGLLLSDLKKHAKAQKDAPPKEWHKLVARQLKLADIVQTGKGTEKRLVLAVHLEQSNTVSTSIAQADGDVVKPAPVGYVCHVCGRNHQPGRIMDCLRPPPKVPVANTKVLASGGTGKRMWAGYVCIICGQSDHRVFDCPRRVPSKEPATKAKAPVVAHSRASAPLVFVATSDALQHVPTYDAQLVHSGALHGPGDEQHDDDNDDDDTDAAEYEPGDEERKQSDITFSLPEDAHMEPTCHDESPECSPAVSDGAGGGAGPGAIASSPTDSHSLDAQLLRLFFPSSSSARRLEQHGYALGDEVTSSAFKEAALLGQVARSDDASDPSADDAPSRVYLNTHEPFCMAAIGVQGSGKSNTLGVVLESCLTPCPRPVGRELIRLKQPMTALVLHYDHNVSSICEATGIISPAQRLTGLNCALPAHRMVVLVSSSYYQQRVKFYGAHCTVKPLLFRWHTLTADQLRKLMRIKEGDNQLYVASMLHLLRKYQRAAQVPDFEDFLREVQEVCTVKGQDGPLKQRMALLEALIYESKVNEPLRHVAADVASSLQSGMLLVADLTDPLLSTDEVSGVFQVLVEQFRSCPVSGGGGKLLAVDEAHRFMSGDSSDGLSQAIVDSARLMRHDGMRLVVSTQSPASLAPELLELVSVAVLHRFHSRDWYTHLSRKLLLDESHFQALVHMPPGSALAFVPRHRVRSQEGRQIMRVDVRQRITADRGASRTNASYEPRRD